MAGLSDGEIAAMRTEAEATGMPGTAVVQTRTRVAAGGGGGSISYSPSSTVSCAIAPLSAQENAEPTTGGKITADSDWIVTLPALTTITTKDRIVIAGTTYEVTSLRAPRSDEITRRVEVSEAL